MVKIRSRPSAAVLAAALALTIVSPLTARTTKEQVLYSFTGGADGYYPQASLTADSGGNLYGAAAQNGINDNGIIFKLMPDGTFAILYSFTGGGDGSQPYGGVNYDEATGDIYGTTCCEGANGYGTIFRLAPNGTLTVLHAFTRTDGSFPQAQMVRDASGNLYGTTELGGAGDCNGYGCGTVFKLASDGTYSVLYSFADGDDGAFPESRPILERNGSLTGVARGGGRRGRGTLYTLAADGKFRVLHRFSGNRAGRYPVGGLAKDSQGNLYGTASSGYPGTGELFKLTPDGTYTVLHTFTGGGDGGEPLGDLLRVGNKFYGTTEGGGADGRGTVFSFTADAAVTTLYSFSRGEDAQGPYAGLVKYKGSLYGTTLGGGAYGYGTVFSLTKR